MRNLSSAAIISALLLVPAFVFAQEADAPATTGATPPTKAERPKPPLMGIPDKARQIASTTRAEVREIKEGARDAIAERRGEIKRLVASSTPAAIRRMLASSTPEDRQQMREEGRARVEEKKAEVRTKIEAAKDKAKEKFSEGVQVSVNNIVDRLSGAIENLGTIATRIDSRISTLQTKGINMDASVTLLAAARADITVAQDKVTAVGVALTAALANATPKAEISKVRDAVRAAEEATRTAKQALQKTLESVRAEGGASVSAPAPEATTPAI